MFWCSSKVKVSLFLLNHWLSRCWILHWSHSSWLLSWSSLFNLNWLLSWLLSLFWSRFLRLFRDQFSVWNLLNGGSLGVSFKLILIWLENCSLFSLNISNFHSLYSFLGILTNFLFVQFDFSFGQNLSCLNIDLSLIQGNIFRFSRAFLSIYNCFVVFSSTIGL